MGKNTHQHLAAWKLLVQFHVFVPSSGRTRPTFVPRNRRGKAEEAPEDSPAPEEPPPAEDQTDNVFIGGRFKPRRKLRRNNTFGKR